MKIELYYNQFSSGGAVDYEKWSVLKDEEINMTYGSVQTLRTAEIEIPDNWTIDKDLDVIYNEEGTSIMFQELTKNDWNKIQIATEEYPYYKTIWKYKEA